jgi:hypothetical protein
MELALHKTFSFSSLQQSAVVTSYVTKDGEGFDYISYYEASLAICNVKLNSIAVATKSCNVSV